MWITDIIAGREFPIAQAAALALALAKKRVVDTEKVMVTTAGIESEEVTVEEGAEEATPEEKLLLVECGLTMMNKVWTHDQEPKTRNGRNRGENSQEPLTVNRMLPITREKTNYTGQPKTNGEKTELKKLYNPDPAQQHARRTAVQVRASVMACTCNATWHRQLLTIIPPAIQTAQIAAYGQ